jgi:transcriptional regulator with XRE-family HTH domain
MSQPALARELGISVASVRRIEQLQRDVSTSELFHIAELCGVPRDFMLYGFTNGDSADHRADSLEAIIEDMARRVERHERLHALYVRHGLVTDEAQDVPSNAPDLHRELDASVKRNTRTRSRK